jgi:SPP1 family predicted phage head-tail adaptor
MKSGKLRHRVEIQAPATTENAKGETVKSWQTVDVVWASVEPVPSNRRFSEAFVALQVVAHITHTITMRFWPITPAHRIKFGNRIFNIDTPTNPEERNIQMVILAREEV